ncbi:MAG: efflux RND transporter permease subunit, partial [Pseudomonadota bacterium]|nr:efflux RND transporter permease subunit [Pseudomonadota bacterium]
TASEVTAQLIPWLEDLSAAWPVGYRWELGGEYESSGKAQASIRAELPVTAFIIAFLLVTQFNSLRRTAIILLTIPLGLIGVMPGLLATGATLGFMTFLGIISLSGIIINNALVLIDRIGLEQKENGLTPGEAVLAAGARRLRPILLTTATTVLGMVPLWIGGGALFQSMAIAIIFGLLFATVLTLGFVPLLYALFFRIDSSETSGAIRST